MSRHLAPEVAALAVALTLLSTQSVVRSAGLTTPPGIEANSAQSG